MTLQEKLQKLITDLEQYMDQMDMDDVRLGNIDILHEKAELALKRVDSQPKDSMEIYEYLRLRFHDIHREKVNPVTT